MATLRLIVVVGIVSSRPPAQSTSVEMHSRGGGGHQSSKQIGFDLLHLHICAIWRDKLQEYTNYKVQ